MIKNFPMQCLMHRAICDRIMCMCSPIRLHFSNPTSLPSSCSFFINYFVCASSFLSLPFFYLSVSLSRTTHTHILSLSLSLIMSSFCSWRGHSTHFQESDILIQTDENELNDPLPRKAFYTSCGDKSSSIIQCTWLVICLSSSIKKLQSLFFRN